MAVRPYQAVSAAPGQLQCDVMCLKTLSGPHTPSQDAEWIPLRHCLESPTCLKCTQMQFDLSSGLWEAHLATTAVLLILLTKCSLEEKKKISTYSDVFVWLCPALVSGCCSVCSANISSSACGSFSITFCCVKTKDVLQKPGREVYFLWSRRRALFIVMKWVWKDIANISTITCFPGCCFSFAGGCFVLLYIKLSADETASIFVCEIISCVNIFQKAYWDRRPGTAWAAVLCMEMDLWLDIKYSMWVSLVSLLALRIPGDWSDTQNIGTIEFFNVNSVIVHTAVLWNIFENYCRGPKKVYCCFVYIHVLQRSM